MRHSATGKLRGPEIFRRCGGEEDDHYPLGWWLQPLVAKAAIRNADARGMRATRLTLVCSGITHRMRKAGFPLDEPLEKRSIELARLLAQHVPKANRVLVAPSLRAQQTAHLMGLCAAVHHSLRDQNYGVWEGKMPDEVEAVQPGSLAAWRADPAYRPGGGEPLTEVATRTARFLDSMRTAGGQLIAVTHPAVVRTAMIHILAAPLTSYWRIDTPPLSLISLYSDSTRWVLRT
ncbi:histidine phosphatase family protein [Mesorhizobium helmanticense]|uniref:Histidine phosphatase family protein n=1 Tax=Mesorhizobium helmanticense TaxID=1776423 RepID=A0A2T4IRC6_9HYPH|nr:histidine phosphatase family protein [Mesorhizobium helmanticense]